MSAALNASGGANQLVAQQAALGQSTGVNAVGSNPYGFQGTNAAAAPANLTGLTGLGGSLQGTPNIAGVSSSGQSGAGNPYNFTVPTGGTGNLSQAQNLLSGASSQFNNASSQNTPRSSGNAGVRLPATSFSAPISNQIQQGGTGAGNSLIQLLQNYKPGTV
jgi:hypothetical protein